MSNPLSRFFVRQDAAYDEDAAKYQAKSLNAKWFYIFMHLAPGFFGLIVLNIPPVYTVLRDLTGLSDAWYQYTLFIIVTYGWHTIGPFIMLRINDGLSFRESLRFIGLDRIDLRGMVIVLPIVFLIFTIVMIPYYEYVYWPLRYWLASLPGTDLPDYSIFKTGFDAFPPIALTMMLIGNFLGEEVYYRGYLMKKCAFLGPHTWWITSFLFTIYHFWQIPLTWSQVGPAMIFGLMMIWRKDIYTLIIIHFIVNLFWLPLMQGTFGGGG